MARLAYRLALASPALQLDLIDASLFGDRAIAAGVRAVPTLLVQGRARFTASDPESLIVAHILENYRSQ